MRFDRRWFEKYQDHLVRFVNTRLGRWFFAIGEDDIPFAKKIMEIAPNRVSLDYKVIKVNGEWRLQKTTVFRTHNRYQKRLEYIYRRMKNIIPAAALAKMMQPGVAGWQVVMPFLALTTDTFYPDPNTETTSVDGWAQDSSSTLWSVLQPAAGDGAADSNAAGSGSDIACPMVLGASPDFYTIRRGIFLFDTSSIDNSAVVSAATFSNYITKTWDEMTTAGSISVCSSAPASNTAIVAGDFDSLGTTKFATDQTIAGISLDAYTDWALNGSGLAAISLTSVTKLGTRCKADIDNSAPTIGGSGNKSMGTEVSFAETTGTSKDPKLAVTYSVPTTYNQTVSSSVNASTSRVVSLTRVISAVVNASTAISALRQANKTVTDTVNASTSRIISITKVIATTVNASTARVISFSRTITANVSAAGNRVISLTRVVADSVRASTAIKILLDGLSNIWTPGTKNAATYTNETKNTATWTNDSKS